MKMTNSYILSVLRTVFCLFLSLLSVNILAGENALSPQQLINSMSRATHALNYDGIFIYRRGRQMDTMRLIHKNGADGEIERLISLTGSPREVIRNKNTVTCIFPDNESVMVEKSRPRKLPSIQLPEPIEKVARHYSFSYEGSDRIAGNEAMIVSIQPNDNYRYGYRLWIDKNSHLLLKSELKNSSGYVLEQIIFTKLDVLDSISDALLKPTVSSDGFKVYSSPALNSAMAEKLSYWKVKWKPDGFEKSNHIKQTIAMSENPVEHMVYTDGIAMVSVFIEKLKKHSQFIPGPSKLGAVNTFARLANGYQVTAVGEVPQVTVQKMAISVITDK